MIIEMEIPQDTRVCDKESEKIKNYSLLKDKTAMIPIVVGPSVVGTTNSRSIFYIEKYIKKYIENLGIVIKTEHVQHCQEQLE